MISADDAHIIPSGIILLMCWKDQNSCHVVWRAVISRGMDGLEKLEAKAEDKGEPEEAAAEIEAGGRRKEIADKAIR